MLYLNIDYLKTSEEIADNIDKIDLSRNILFITPEHEIDKLYFNLSGGIQYILGSAFNVSNLPNDLSSPFLIYKKNLNLKISTPVGITLLFNKPNNTKYIINTSQSYNIKTIFELEKIKNNFNTSSSILYQDLSCEIIFYKSLLLKEYSTMILPASFVLFNLFFLPTVFSENKVCDQIYVIQNNEFYYNFHEVKE